MEIGETVKERMIIAMKGQPGTGKSNLASSMAKVFKCPVISTSDVSSSNENNSESCFHSVCRIASKQLGLDLNVIIDSSLWSRAHLNALVELSNSTKAPLVVVHCKPRHMYGWYKNRGSSSWTEYEDRDVGKIIVDTTSFPKVTEVCRAIEYVAALGRPVTLDFGQLKGDDFESIGSNDKGNAKQKFHIHELKLCGDSKSSRISCDSCLAPIPFPSERGSYYKCKECDLYMHKWCAESAPMRATPPLSDLNEYSFGKRHRCGTHQNDTFQCQTCLFETNLRCACLPSVLKHKCHDHPLHIRLYPQGMIKELFQCLACGELGKQHALYKCSSCDFVCHIDCALKPRTFETVHHRHSLTFTSSPQDGDPNSICDICENERNPKYWTYRCPRPECDITCHLICKTPYGS